ncbi:MAG: choice-of-anchor B family protein, partial [Planctomycetota bacterium]
MGLQSGFGYVEITDPTNPQIIATIPGPSSIWHDVKVIGQYAYGVSEGGAGIQVMDLSQIDSGVVTLVRNQQSGGHSRTHNIVSNEEAGSLWLVGANVGNGGLVGLNLSDPEAPTLQGGWTDMYVHDAQVVTWNEGPFAGREIAFCASGFDSGFTATGLRIVDVTNRNNPVVIGELFYPSAGYSHQVWLSDDRTTLYLNDELDEQNGQVNVTTTRIIDVTDLTNPTFRGTHTTGLQAADHNLYTVDEFVFQANYRSGLRVFNAADPLNPVEVAFFDSFPNSNSSQFNGAWSSYPFFDSGTVIMSDIERGLFVLRVDAIEDERVRIRPAGDRPETIDPAGGQTVRALVEGVNVSIDAGTVRLVVDDADGTQSVIGTPIGGGVYEFTFPVVSCATPVSYSFAADATTGQTGVLPVNASVAPYTADVVSGVAVEIADDFETDQGWSVSGSISDASAGRWERGTPVGG